MLKPLTFSLSLALALGLCSVSMAGGQDDNCTTCGLASPQGGVYATGQGAAAGCEPAPCAPKKHCFSFHMPKIKCHLPKLVHTCSYEWVLKKKHCFSLQKTNKCNDGGCSPVYATGQGGAAPSGQAGAAPSGQYSSVYGAGQHAFTGARPASIAAAPAEMTPAIIPGEEAPPAPEVSTTRGLLLPTPAGN
jgi:hypothetical protein